MIESVSRTSAVYAELPHKFEAGTVNAAGAVGLKSAIDYVKAWALRKYTRESLKFRRMPLRK